MPDNANRDKNMGAGDREDPGHSQRQGAPGRDQNDDLSTGGRQGGGVRGSNREGFEGGLDREDREREQPGSKQTNQNR